MTDEAELYYAQFMKALGVRIKEFRKQRGLSLRDMVVKHEYHDSQWRKYEREGASSVSSLLRIARALNTTIVVLLDGLGDYPSSKAGVAAHKSVEEHSASSSKPELDVVKLSKSKKEESKR